MTTSPHGPAFLPCWRGTTRSTYFLVRRGSARTEGWEGERLEQLAIDARRGTRAARMPVAMDVIRRAILARTRLPNDVRRAAAVHEAGLAFVGLALGRVVGELTISEEIDAIAGRLLSTEALTAAGLAAPDTLSLHDLSNDRCHFPHALETASF